MNGQRALRRPGETLQLSSGLYRLSRTASEVGSTVLYSAAKAGSGPWTDCLIREFCPDVPGVHRDITGELCWEENARILTAPERNCFILQQQAEAELLAGLPGSCAANSNLYEAYGTLYAVRTLSNAVSLKTLLEQNPGCMPLEEALPVIDKILESLERLHQKGFLHLSISPSRIMFLPEDVVVLDFHTLWNKERLLFWDISCCDPSYTAPELQLKNLQQAGVAADLYSVCAVLFRLLMGRPLQESEILGQGLYRNLALELSDNLSIPACSLIPLIHVLQKGLHTLPHRRWKSTAQLRTALRQASSFTNAASVQII